MPLSRQVGHRVRQRVLASGGASADPGERGALAPCVGRAAVRRPGGAGPRSASRQGTAPSPGGERTPPATGRPRTSLLGRRQGDMRRTYLTAGAGMLLACLATWAAIGAAQPQHDLMTRGDVPVAAQGGGNPVVPPPPSMDEKTPPPPI